MAVYKPTRIENGKEICNGCNKEAPHGECKCGKYLEDEIDLEPFIIVGAIIILNIYMFLYYFGH